MKNDIIQFINNILQSNNIPARYFMMPSQEEDLQHFFQNFDLGLRSRILGMTGHLDQFAQWLFSKKPAVIYLIRDLFLCNYVMLFVPEKGKWFFCGPVLFEEMNDDRFANLTSYLELPDEFHANLKFYYEHLSFFPSNDLLKSMFCELGNFLYGEGNFEIEYHDGNSLDMWHYNYKNYLRIPEEPFRNIHIIESRYEAENAMMEAVRKCDEDAALEAITKFHAYMLPIRLPDRLRDMKDYTITFNTLLRKSAEMAGVHPIHIDSHSNGTIPQIEQLTNVNQCIAFHKRMVHEYCDLIRNHSLRQYSTIIGKTLTYIHTDIGVDLSLNVLAEQLNINASYLSMLFKKEIGMTLTDYVNKYRIEHAAKLLLCTNLPIKSIAVQCGIPDIYYFTRLFKRIMGTTPKAFRIETPHEARSDLLKLKKTESSDAAEQEITSS